MKRAESIFLREDVAAFLQDADPFAVLPQQPGATFRSVARRQTRRVVLNERAYFLKHHLGVGWGEIAKNLITLRWPVVSARNEFEKYSILKRDYARMLLVDLAST